MPREVKCTTWKGEPFRYAHAKRDGIWLELIKDAQGAVSAWTRQPRDVTAKLLAWNPALRLFTARAPVSTVLYCELWVQGLGRDAVKGAMRDSSNKLRIECFAVEKYGGNAASGFEALEHCEMLAKDCGVSFVPWVDELPYYCDQDGDIPDHHLREFDRQMMLDAALPDTEGWVLKDGNLLNWRKLKARETYDLRVIGFTAGRKKYTGVVGALVLESSNGRQVKCSGMSDDDRWSMQHEPDEWLGKIVEVECQGRGSAGGLAHPRYLRVREDKAEPDELGDES